MWQAFEHWSYTNLGQWHYVLGYSINLVSHNWPILLVVVLGPWFGYWAYTRPGRTTVSWLLSTILLGVAYEYWKHVAGELHQAVDFLFSMEIEGLRGLLHVLVGPVITTALLLSFLAMLGQSVRLTLIGWGLRRRPRPGGPQDDSGTL